MRTVHVGLPEANAAMLVTGAFQVFVVVGYADSNTWVGAARACATVYLSTRAVPGDVIENLYGGVFLRPGGEAGARLQVTTSINPHHPFLKYTSHRVTWPADSLCAVALPAAPAVHFKPLNLTADGLRDFGDFRLDGGLPDVVLDALAPERLREFDSAVRSTIDQIASRCPA